MIASQSHDFDTFTWIELRIGQLKLKEECHAEHRNSRERKGLTQVYPHDAFGLHGDFAVVKHIGSIMVRAFSSGRPKCNGEGADVNSEVEGHMMFTTEMSRSKVILLALANELEYTGRSSPTRSNPRSANPFGPPHGSPDRRRHRP